MSHRSGLNDDSRYSTSKELDNNDIFKALRICGAGNWWVVKSDADNNLPIKGSGDRVIINICVETRINECGYYVRVWSFLQMPCNCNGLNLGALNDWKSIERLDELTFFLPKNN